MMTNDDKIGESKRGAPWIWLHVERVATNKGRLSKELRLQPAMQADFFARRTRDGSWSESRLSVLRARLTCLRCVLVNVQTLGNPNGDALPPRAFRQLTRAGAVRFELLQPLEMVPGVSDLAVPRNSLRT